MDGINLRAITTVLLLAFGVGLAACDGQAGEGATAVPGSGGGASTTIDPTGRADGESPQELADRLHALVQQQRDHTALADDDPKECEDLCSLSTSICGVKEKLCRIADERVGEESYQQLCREAKQECRDAQDSCMDCVEKHVHSQSGRPASSDETPDEAKETTAPE
jgi:hypothetical protein